MHNYIGLNDNSVNIKIRYAKFIKKLYFIILIKFHKI